MIVMLPHCKVRDAASLDFTQYDRNIEGLPQKSPHQFRHGHAVYVLQHAKTVADYKAVSMNLMHVDIRVTDGICPPLAGHEV